MEGATEKIKSQEVRLLGNFYGPLMKVGLPLIKDLNSQLSKRALLPLGRQQRQQKM